MHDADRLRKVWAANLDEALTAAGLRDVDVAAELDRHQQTVKRWRTGETEIPDDMKARLATLLKVDGRDLFPFEVAA
jgi:ribosome-binding protein aMBF1 (putative translation factor)